MSGNGGSGANYNGTQPTNTSYVKNFVTGSMPDVWKYSTIDGIKYLTPASSTASVYLYNDLVVIGSILNSSDAELKTGVVGIPSDPVNGLMRIQPCQYSYKSDEQANIHYGFIAQQVEPLFPSLVKEHNGVKTVNYIEMIPLMLAKIQDLQSQIDELNNR